MKKLLVFFLISFFILCLLSLDSCRKDSFWVSPPPPPPRVPNATSTLEATYVTSAPIKVSSAYWKTADYLKINVQDIAKGQLYGNCLLNMTGLFSGKSGFNGGIDPNFTMKAAYDDSNLYLLAEWTDSKVNAEDGSWLWNASTDPLKTGVSSDGWTSQRSNDGLGLAFEITPASNNIGVFNNVGCQASCHNDGGGTYSMRPDNGKVDIWNWNTAHTNPLGYAQDLVANAAGFANDAGQNMYVRNGTDCMGPLYEYNGVQQTVKLPNGQTSILDAAFYLLNKTSFTGNPKKGDSLYHKVFFGNQGSCATCHGERGEGGEARSVNDFGLTKKTRATMIADMDNESDMVPYWSILNNSQRDDIIAYLRGLAGVPGYYIQSPTESCADVKAYSNITPIDISNAQSATKNVHARYQVLLVRKLKTNNSDDIQFDLPANKVYKFGVAIMDNDRKNHIGSAIETLTFK